jgi:hypothetical protein
MRLPTLLAQGHLAGGGIDGVGVAIPQTIDGVTVQLSSNGTYATITWNTSPSPIDYYLTRIPDNGDTPTTLPEVAAGTYARQSVVDTGLNPAQITGRPSNRQT